MSSLVTINMSSPMTICSFGSIGRRVNKGFYFLGEVKLRQLVPFKRKTMNPISLESQPMSPLKCRFDRKEVQKYWSVSCF